MKTNIVVSEVKPAVKFVAGIVSRRSSLPVLQSVKCYANGAFELTATDLDCWLQAKAPNKSTVDGMALIPASTLVSAVGGRGEIALETGERNIGQTEEKEQIATFRTGTMVQSVPLIPVAEFPPLPVWPADSRVINLDAQQFRTALKSVAVAMSTDESRYVLNGVCIEIAPDAIKLIATDGRRLHCASLAHQAGITNPDAINLALIEKEMAEATLAYDDAKVKYPPVLVPVPNTDHYRYEAAPEFKALEARRAELNKRWEELKQIRSILIPSVAVKHLLRMPLPKLAAACLSIATWETKQHAASPEGNVVVASCSYVRIDCGDYAVLSKQIDGNYPNFRQVIPQDCPRLVQVNLASLAAAVEQVGKVCTEKENSVKLSFSFPNKVTVSAKSGLGDASIDVDVDYSGPEFAIAFNPEYLVEACESFTLDESAVLHFSDGTSPVKAMQSAGGIELLAVVMPMRMS